jgi:Spy/CpxP family protein refolding chaperone
MTNPIRFLALLLTVAAAGLVAQPPRGYFPWWDSPLVRDINLTEDQQRQVREVVREFRGKLIDARAAVEKAEAEVEDLFNEDQTEARRAGEAVDRLVAARGEMTRAFAQMSLRLRSVLTPQQWRQLRQRRDQQPRGPQSPQEPMRPRMRQGRPGMPGRPQQPQPPQPPKPPAETGSPVY